MKTNKFDLSDHRKKQLSEYAEFIADEYFKDTLVDPHRLAEIYGITSSFGDYGRAFDGMLEYCKEQFHVYLNSNKFKHKYTTRGRFTMAHELGHFLIDEHRTALEEGLAPSHPSFIDFSSDNEVELEADYFAASLLLPTSRLIKDINRKIFTFNLIEELSAKYQVSITATLLKFAAVGNHPIMIVCSVNSVIKWFKYSSDFPFKYIEARPGFKVPVNTCAGQYFYENRTKNQESEIVFAEDWFRLNYDEDYGRQFFEHCIYADAYNFVLSVIWER